MARKLLPTAHGIHPFFYSRHVRIAWKLLPFLCLRYIRMARKLLPTAHGIHPFFYSRHVRIAWKLLPFLCLRYIRMARKLLPTAHEIHPLSCSRHVRIAWKIQYKAHEIHPNHKENHFFWNFSFKYFAVSIIIHNFALAFNKEAGRLQSYLLERW